VQDQVHSIKCFKHSTGHSPQTTGDVGIGQEADNEARHMLSLT
jgi:hypothetical protein